LTGFLVLVILWQPQWLLRRIARRHPTVLFHVRTSRNIVALTIDDGPHPEVTPMILDVLARHRATATFFLLGTRVRGNEGCVERIIREGHELGNHLMDDRPGISLSGDEFEHQLLKAHLLLERFAPIRWFRPGSGWFNQRMVDQIHHHGYRCVLGSVYPYDAHIACAGIVTTFLLLKIFPGAIVVLHDGEHSRRKTVAILDHVIPRLQLRGYSVVSLSELIKAS
jgi:peptidoglycan/xylan/chitin deacetylase (PgdA/CDA1 family)